MSAKDLSILIPARNEEFLAKTIEDIVSNIEADTEIIAVLDGEWANPPIPQHPWVNVIYLPISIGQRAATNLACKLSKAKYIMKVDAHCAFDKGFDRKLIEDMQDDWTVVPTMRNLYCFDWICKCGFTHYQDKGSICPQCSNPMEKKMIWEPRKGTRNYSYCFDSEPHFQYANAMRDREDFKEGSVIGYDLFVPSNLLENVGALSQVGSQPTLSASVIRLLTDLAGSHKFSSDSNFSGGGKYMPIDTVSLSSIDDSRSVGAKEILRIRNELKVRGITTSSIFAEMVNNKNIPSSSSGNLSNKPSIKNTVYHFPITETGAVTISTFVDSSCPVPTTSKRINSDIIDKLNREIGGKFVYNEKVGSFHNGSVTLIPIRDKDITETMSLQGSCFMLTREKYWELDICDEKWGSWGSQGIEVAVKTWLSGGRVICNHNTWYAHMFRTKSANGFGFPYPQSGKQVDNAKKMARDLFFNNKWDKAIRPLSWLVEKFMPISYWTQEDLDNLKKMESVVK